MFAMVPCDSQCQLLNLVFFGYIDLIISEISFELFDLQKLGQDHGVQLSMATFDVGRI